MRDYEALSPMLMFTVQRVKFWSFRREEWIYPPGSCSGSLATTAAVWALVVIDVLGLGRSDLDTLAMEPCLAGITAYPELILSIVVATRTTQCAFMVFLFLIFLASAVILILWGWHLGTP
jgi:hypothetical protein